MPQWPAPARVKALCTTRAGGISTAPWDSLNLGGHVGDDAQRVQHNRRVLQQAVAARPVFMNQVHGCEVLTLSTDLPDGRAADAACTTQIGLACTVMVADCLPVLLCDTAGQMVAAAHAGWRGLAGTHGTGVLEAVFKCFDAIARTDVAQPAMEVIAWLGPCIGPGAFEVGEEVRAAFVAHSMDAARCFQPLGNDKWLADLAGLARQRLNALGVRRVFGNDSGPEWCTAGNPSRFFSHRRDRISGRQAACIWLE
ncbi:MAG: peptidoglycan editing factor PgeF [Burkholderiales bacterium]|nr:peptidoglycan editing factor PgeF [Burkholderiales bacterium]